jgi:hypothetical protein
MILWEKRTAILQGYELDASNMGGWMLDKHHVLDIQNGKTFFTLVNDNAVCVCVCVCECVRAVVGWKLQEVSNLKYSIKYSDED